MDHNFATVIVFLVLAAATLDRSGGRDLRPADHGLVFEEESSSPPAAEDGGAEEMLSFFGAAAAPPVQLPEAKNISGAWRSARGAEGTRSRDVGRDHVRVGLLIGSGVCGLIGVVLLTVSAIVFLARLKKPEPEPKPKPEAGRITSTSASAFVVRSHAVNEKL